MKITKGPVPVAGPTSAQKGNPIPGFGFGIMQPKQQNRFVVEYEIDSVDTILSRQTIAVHPNFDDNALDIILEDDVLGNTVVQLWCSLKKAGMINIKMLDGAENVLMTWQYTGANLQTFHFQQLDYATGNKVTLLARFIVSDWEIIR